MGCEAVRVGKSTGIRPGDSQGEPSGEPMAWRDASKKEPLAVDGDRTKTDTGRWDEYSQARERTLVKELGKLSP